MPILKETKAANGVSVSYHTPIRMEVDLVNNIATLIVQSHTDQQAKLANLPLAWTWSMSFPMNQIVGTDDMMGNVEEALITLPSSPFVGGEHIMDATQDVKVLKARKVDEVNQAYQKANLSTFSFNGVDVDYDASAQININATNGIIALTQEMPENWPGVWKAADNSYIEIPDVATWVSFYKAMNAQGTANFLKAQQLKAAIEAAETLEDVVAIKW